MPHSVNRASHARVSFEMSFRLRMLDEESGHIVSNQDGPGHAFLAGAVALSGAGDGTRTRDSLLGRQMRYHCATPAQSASVDDLDY